MKCRLNSSGAAHCRRDDSNLVVRKVIKIVASPFKTVGQEEESCASARRIRAIRLEQPRSIDTTEAQAAFEKELLVRLENRQQAPSRENLQRLAVVLGVPVHQFFFADGEHLSTPWLTPRLSLDDLAALDAQPQRSVSV
jgi:transcriptional regulator with XRE-family HTH domain